MNIIIRQLLSILILFSFCCASDSKSKKNQKICKWEISSDYKPEKSNPKEPPKNQYIFKVKAKASSSAIEEKNFPKIMSTCVQIAKSQAGYFLMEGIFLNYFQTKKGNESGSIYLLGKENSEQYKCNFTISEKTAFSECKGEVKGIQSSSCYALSSDPNHEDYGSCECAFKWNFEGGETELNKMIKHE